MAKGGSATSQVDEGWVRGRRSVDLAGVLSRGSMIEPALGIEERYSHSSALA